MEWKYSLQSRDATKLLPLLRSWQGITQFMSMNTFLATFNYFNWCLLPHEEGANSVHRAGKGLKCNDQISLDQPILTSLELSVNLYLNLVYNSSRLIVEQTTNNSHQTPTLKYKNRTMTCLRTQSQGCVAKWIIYGIMFVKPAISNLGSSLELAWNS